MKTNKTPFRNHWVYGAFLLALSLFLQTISACNQGPPPNSRQAQALAGKAIFENQCISCHGLNEVEPTVDTLSTPAPDLTRIMARRPKAKEFPIVEIARIIDGRRAVKAHGPRTMPVWGEVYTQEGLDKSEILGRKGELVAYLMSIQDWDY